jgi:hypothetical protein
VQVPDLRAFYGPMESPERSFRRFRWAFCWSTRGRTGIHMFDALKEKAAKGAHPNFVEVSCIPRAES